MKYAKTMGAIVAGLALSAATSQAIFLPPGGLNIPAPPTDTGVGSVLQPLGFLSSPYASGGLSGTLRSWVVLGDISNPFGGLSFYYQLVTTGSQFTEHVSLNGFGTSLLIDVQTGIPAGFPFGLPGGSLPTGADRSFFDGGNVVTFDYPAFSAVAPGSHSSVMVVNTAYTLFAQNTAGVIDGTATSARILAPFAPVPEPTTIVAGVLLLLPLGASAIRILRKGSPMAA
jgi:hypothetical protein